MAVPIANTAVGARMDVSSTGCIPSDSFGVPRRELGVDEICGVIYRTVVRAAIGDRVHPIRMRSRRGATVRLRVVTARAPLPSTQLLVYGFGADADFEGQLVGALERIESGGALRILDALFVARDAETGELVAIGLEGDGAGGIVAPLLDFRLDAVARRRATERALDTRTGGELGELLRTLGSALEPGAALVALLVEHRWARALEDAVSRTGGAPLASEFVEATALTDLAPALLAALGPGRGAGADR